jgi:hypothetical protein
MSILAITTKERNLLKASDSPNFESVAYKRRYDIPSYCMTAYKLLVMYGLQGRLTSKELQRIRDQIIISYPLYVTDLGDITSIGRSIALLDNLVAQSTYNAEYQQQIRILFEQYSVDYIKNASSTSNLKWYGYPTPEYLDYITGVKKVYPRLEDARKFFDEFESELRINPETDVPKPRTSFTSRPNGIFTFARAASTLYAFPCYKTEESDETCISPSLVTARDGRYYLSEAPDVEVGIYGYEKRESGVSKFRTQTKRVYATKIDKTKLTPYINIYVNVSAASDVKADSYRYNSFAAIALAKLLTENGFKVSITTIFIAETQTTAAPFDYKFDDKDKAYFESGGAYRSYSLTKFTAKSYDELLDFNAALIYGGDPAFFRYEMFKAHTLTSIAWYRKIPLTLGFPVTHEPAIDNVLDLYNVNSIANETRVIISGYFSKKSAIDAVRTKLAELKLLYGARR